MPTGKPTSEDFAEHLVRVQHRLAWTPSKDTRICYDRTKARVPTDIDGTARRLRHKNPVVCLGTYGHLNRIAGECDGAEQIALFRELGLPEQYVVRSSAPDRLHFHYLVHRDLNVSEEPTKFRVENGVVTASIGDGYVVAPGAWHEKARCRYTPLEWDAELYVLSEEEYQHVREWARQHSASRSNGAAAAGVHGATFDLIVANRIAGMSDEENYNDVRRQAQEKVESGEWHRAPTEREVRDGIARCEATASTRVEEPTEPEIEWNGDLAKLLREVRTLLTDYHTFTDDHAVVFLALWVAHTHAFRFAEVTPYAGVESPTMRCGKSNLLKTLLWLCAEARMFVNPTDPSVFRSLDAGARTLLIDEADRTFSNTKDREDQIAMYNAGYEEGATIPRVEGEGGNRRVVEFPVFSPKAFASIGAIPDAALHDRLVVVPMKRRLKSETGLRYRRKIVKSRAHELRDQLAAWARSADFSDAEPSIPDELDDRAMDMWEPLLAIADAAGKNWARKAREAALVLSGNRDDEDATEKSLDVLLLEAIWDAFERVNWNDLSSLDLVTSLCSDEDAPWRGFWWNARDSKPKEAAQSKLAYRLRKWGIRPDRVGHRDERKRGYRADMFSDAWARWLGRPLPDPSTSSTVDTRGRLEPVSEKGVDGVDGVDGSSEGASTEPSTDRCSVCGEEADLPYDGKCLDCLAEGGENG